MGITESYLFLLSDSFFSSLILTPGNEFVVKLMVSLSGYNLYLVFTITLFGSIVGSLANWQIGKYCKFLYNTDFFKSKDKEITKAKEKWDKFLVYILLFSWVSVIGGPFSVLSGFFKTDLKKFLILIGISKAIFYSLLVFSDIDISRW